MKTDSRTLCDMSAQGRFHLILSSRFAFLTLPFSLLVPFYLYFFTSGWSSLSSSCGFQFPSVRLCLKYADISDVCILFSLSRTSRPEARSKTLGDGHVTNVRLAVRMRVSLPTLYIATRPHLMFLLSFLFLIYINYTHSDDLFNSSCTAFPLFFKRTCSLSPSLFLVKNAGRWTTRCNDDCL